jgi:predicted site-specific integrase-resolvase
LKIAKTQQIARFFYIRTLKNISRFISKTVEKIMNIGYARVSTDDQKLDLQMDALWGAAKIYNYDSQGKNPILIKAG